MLLKVVTICNAEAFAVSIWASKHTKTIPNLTLGLKKNAISPITLRGNEDQQINKLKSYQQRLLTTKQMSSSRIFFKKWTKQTQTHIFRVVKQSTENETEQKGNPDNLLVVSRLVSNILGSLH